MDGKARLGRWVLLAVIAATALAELAVAGFSLQAGRFRISQISRVALTGWLLWQVWDGTGWARWLLSVLFLGSGVFSVAYVIGSPVIQGRPEAAALLIGLGAIFAAFGVGLASPWVGAYQASRRVGEVAEPGAGSDRWGP